jgi:hypothetical protein
MSAKTTFSVEVNGTRNGLATVRKLAGREVRGYESEYCGALLHWDCHVASRKVLTPRGEWQTASEHRNLRMLAGSCQIPAGSAWRIRPLCGPPPTSCRCVADGRHPPRQPGASTIFVSTV